MACHIRRALEADAEALTALNADVQSLHAAAMPERFKPTGPNSFPAAEARALLANANNLVFIAETSSGPAGYAYAEIIQVAETSLTYARREIHLHHISVRPADRRTGIASALLDAVRKAGTDPGIDLVTLQVWSFNEAAQAFFQRQGFEPYITRLWNRHGTS